VDWYSIGILTYEMVVGVPPFFHDNPRTLSKLILQQNFKWDPRLWKGDEYALTKDWILALATKDAKKRLGSNGGGDEVMVCYSVVRSAWAATAAGMRRGGFG
jgi:serine/threonine protein kinase